MSIKLRDLIRSVRSCKTAAEERSVISRESAMIRTAIREEQEQFRHRNVAKLLFMHMLGYPTHFGQLECLKLIASPHFPEKRIGYLGLMLLLSEEADVLMLATNSLKNDLNHANEFIVGLALCTIGNLATPDMSRDLATEVDKHLRSGSPYLRKKAALAMARCLTKCPDMAEDFIERIVSLLKDRSHGVLITAVQLMVCVCEIEPDLGKAAFVRLVPSLVRLLRNLLSMGYSPEHDVSGISDPFLQVQLLTLLRILGEGNEETSEGMNDILAQVATNTETAKNAGNAILYECVQCIMSVESEAGLRVLAINILGRFLLNRDNNIRYVALNTLGKVVLQDSAAVQRHRNTIVDCLKDPDVSIRTRSLDLIFKLVTDDNVETLTAELLNYLVISPAENRVEVCTKVLKVVDQFSPSPRWRVDTLITLLTIAGKDCKESVLASTIAYISRSADDLRAYCTHKLVKAMRDDDGSQEGLLVVGIWCVGEYGEYLLQPYSNAETEARFNGVVALDVIKLVDDITKKVTCTDNIKQRALTCFAKLTERFANCDPAVVVKLKILIKKYESSMNLELQLRSCEYSVLVNGVGAGALARMPVVDPSVAARKAALSTFGGGMSGGDLLGDAEEASGGAVAAVAPVKVGGDLLDLDDIFGGGGGSAPAAAGVSAPAVQASQSSDADLLSDIFAASALAPAQPAAPAMPAAPAAKLLDPFAAQPPATPAQPAANLMDPFAAPAAALQQPMVAAPTNPIVPGFNQDGLEITFECKEGEVVAHFKNSLPQDMTGLVFQAAVPKYLTMSMEPPSQTTIKSNGGNNVTQSIKISNSMVGTKKVMMKLKLSYTVGGKKVDAQATANQFPMGY